MSLLTVDIASQTGAAPNLCPWACAPSAAVAHLAGDARRMVLLYRKRVFTIQFLQTFMEIPCGSIVSLPSLVSVFTQFLVFLLK